MKLSFKKILVLILLFTIVIHTSYKYYETLVSPTSDLISKGLEIKSKAINIETKELEIESKVINRGKKARDKEIMRNKYINKKKSNIPYITVIESKVTNSSFLKTTLKSAGKEMSIFLHYRGDHISNMLLKDATWEPHLLNQFETYIKEHPGIQVLDAGCNLGVYTLTAAALGSKVVAVDANSKNTDRLSQSLYVNNLGENVTICLNALNSQRKDFVLSSEYNNIGGQHVIESRNDSKRVIGIIIDDLVPLFDKDKPILIKIDIQGRETEAFKNATRFFEERNVMLIMIEWEMIKTMPEVTDLISFFIKRGYKPYKEYKKIHKLNISDFKSWPYDLMWIKV